MNARSARQIAVGMLCTLLLCAAAPALATEVWTPATGEVNLEEMPRETPEQRYRHAAALVGAGQVKSGLRALRRLQGRDIGDDLRPRVEYSIILARLRLEKYRKAFDEAETFLAAYPDHELAGEVVSCQLQAAHATLKDSLTKGLQLYERIISAAETPERAAFLMKEKADALLAEGYYLGAMDEYLAVVDYYPESEWFPYCWYRVGICKLRQAQWLELGGEHIRDAMQELNSFVQTYPSHQYAAGAREALEEARRAMAARDKELALYYLEARERPVPAARCLERIAQNYPGTDEAAWAAEKLKEIRARLQTPLRGDYVRTPLPGVEAQK